MYACKATAVILRSLPLRDNTRADTARLRNFLEWAGGIVRIHNGRVNRTSLCNKSEKWKSPGQKKGVPNFETPNSVAIAKIYRPAKARDTTK
jgi:hypothetical protein